MVFLYFALLRRPRVLYRDDTRVQLNECGAPRPFVKTFDYNGSTINAEHAGLGAAPTGRMGLSFCIDLGIDGYLQRPEAMKLYEIGYFSRGDIIELGTYRGLSASILSRALFDRGKGMLETCDIDPDSTELAKKNLLLLPGVDRVRFHTNDAAAFLDEMIRRGRRFGPAFVDHWHGYDATREAIIRMPRVLSKGAFIIFHDYNDPCSLIEEHPNKVFQAVSDTLDRDRRFRFCCVVESMAVYRMQ